MPIKLAFITVSTVAATAVLWLPQTPDALMRVGSFPAGIAQVAFWAAPALLAYALLLRTRPGVLLGGTVLIALLTWTWWSTATDWHSTASVGPGSVGWLLGPVGVFVPRQLEGRMGRRRPEP